MCINANISRKPGTDAHLHWNCRPAMTPEEDATAALPTPALPPPLRSISIWTVPCHVYACDCILTIP
jgi:hypothetical protein